MRGAEGRGAVDPVLLDRLEAVIIGRRGRRDGREIRFLCPAHPDREHPSAAWNPGKLTWHCYTCGAGGGARDLAQRLGLPLPSPASGGLTVEALAAAKALPPEFLRELGVADGWVGAGAGRQTCVDIPYSDSDGVIVAIRKRLSLRGDHRFRWRRGDRPLPYGVWRVEEARQAGYLLLVEGETDAWTLWYAGVPALGVPGASAWRREWFDLLKGIPAVYVWREPDAGGTACVERIAASRPDALVIAAPADAKDPSELWLAVRDRDAFCQRLQALRERAQPPGELQEQALREAAARDWALAEPLLRDPRLLHRIVDAIRAGGYAGNPRPALLAYVALTSRLLECPLNIAFIAPSAAGKSRAVEAALALMPASAYHLEKAGSARALIYSDADFQHRTVVVAEADSIPEEGPAASALRALAADNEMAYDVVERHEATGRHSVRHIVKPGPTGLITTSTGPLGEQMATRMLTVAIPDTPEQTREVIRAHAASVAGPRPEPDVGALVALQRWLEIAGDHKVVVPFAEDLAEAVPADLVRMRRDFRQLLTVVQAIALLYQRQRARDGQGHIVATLEDYALARDLLLDVFAEAATGGVSQALRDTVQAVARLSDGQNGVTLPALADALGLHRTTVWRRVRTAVRLGYLINLSTGKGQPARLVPGDPLPEERPALPHPEELHRVCVGRSEIDATVQHAPSARISPESGEPVARVAPVATTLQEAMQRPGAPPSDSETTAPGPRVAPLHADPADLHTQRARDAVLPLEGPLDAGTDEARRAGSTGSSRPRCSIHLPGRCPDCGAEVPVGPEPALRRGTAPEPFRSSPSAGSAPFPLEGTPPSRGPRTEVLFLAQRTGWPRVPYKSPHTVAPGPAAWRAFVRTASDGDLALADAALRAATFVCVCGAEADGYATDGSPRCGDHLPGACRHCGVPVPAGANACAPCSRSPVVPYALALGARQAPA